MNAIEKRIDELNRYCPDRTAPADLKEFWERTKAEAIETDFSSNKVEKTTYMADMKVYEVQYEGFGDTQIHGLFMLPKHASEEKPRPCLVTFPGYTSDKGTPDDFARWIMMGIAVFSVDVRGQGGETGNRLGSSHGMTKGWVTEGLLDLEYSYYKAMAVDALRAVSWASKQPEIDTSRIGAMGASQGGGLALLVTALHEAVCMTVADVPSLCHIDYGVLHSTGTLSEVAEFCRKHPDQLSHVLNNLSHFDLLNLADRIHVPVLISVGLKDPVCTPEQIFPVFHSLASVDKKLEIYPFTAHTVEPAQKQKAIDFVYERFFE
jgi:cephalosporin-C deacetylase